MSGRRYTDEQRTEAVELARATTLAQAHRHTGIPRSTIRRWLQAAGAEAGDRAHGTDSAQTARARTAAAVEAAAEARARQREEVADYALGKLAPKAAGMILARLEGEARLSAVFDEALDELLEARQLVKLAADLGPDEAKAARMAVQARGDVLRALDSARIDVRTLVGVLTRSVHDHLALTGDLEELRAAGEVHVTFGIPRSDPDDLEGIVDEPTATAAAEEERAR